MICSPPGRKLYWRPLFVLAGLAASCQPPTAEGPTATVWSKSQQPEDADEAVDTSFGAFDPLRDVVLPGQAGEEVSYYQALAGQPLRADYLVQFHTAIDADARAAVADSGAQVVGYMPHHTLVVAATDNQRDGLSARDDVRAVVALPPQLRVAPDLFGKPAASHTGGPDGPLHLAVGRQADVTVELDDPNHVALVAQALAHTSSRVVGAEQPAAEDVEGSSRVLHVQLDATGLGRLSRLAEVVAIERRRPAVLLNERSTALVQGGDPWQRPAHLRALDGNGQRVAVADTGLDTRSCFFKEAAKVVAYQHYAAPPYRPMDADGHGTHVAGTVAGDCKKSRDGGIAPKAQLVVQHCDLTSQSPGFGIDVEKLLRGALQANALVQTNSWGSAGAAYTIEARAVDRFVRRHPEMVVVAAVGNAGDQGPATVFAPATAKSVVAVGAYDGENDQRVAWFSSQGPTDDGRLKPTVLAPGINIRSARAGSRCKTQVMSGTSMAAPLVAGAAALVRQFFIEGHHGSERQPSAALVKAVLLAGAEPLTGGQGGGSRLPVADMWQQGFGRVRLDRALGLAPQGPALWVADGEVALDTGEAWEACFAVAPDTPLDVALSWADAPARQGAAVALVQDLDLELWAADGSVLLGNAGLEGAAVAPIADDRNVEEVIRHPKLPAGTTCVRVVARQTPLAPQSFAVALLTRAASPIVAGKVAP